MLRWLLHRKLNSEEKKLGESVDYLRHVVDVSPGAFLRFASILPFANSRKVLPKDAWFVAQLAAVEHEDCGTCVQITVKPGATGWSRPVTVASGAGRGRSPRDVAGDGPTCCDLRKACLGERRRGIAARNIAEAIRRAGA